MAGAGSFAQIEAQIRKRMNSAMNVVQSKVLADMYEEVGAFYTQGSPKLYTRTGALGNSPNVTSLSSGGNSVSFKAYLRPSGYNVPNPAFTERGHASYFSPMQVLTAAENHTSGVLGRPHFWQRSLVKMESTFNSVMSSFFS